MRKKVSTLLILTAIILSIIGIPTSYAARPRSFQRVRGYFDYEFDLIADPVVVDDKTFLFAEEWETWVGDFDGDGHAYFIVIAYDSGLLEVVLYSVFTGEVGDSEGTCVLRLIGKKPAGKDWMGTWSVISGTDGLANLRGSGVWWGPGGGADGPDIRYSGYVHFAYLITR